MEPSFMATRINSLSFYDTYTEKLPVWASHFNTFNFFKLFRSGFICEFNNICDQKGKIFVLKKTNFTRLLKIEDNIM